MTIQVTQNLPLFLQIAEVICTGLCSLPEGELVTLVWGDDGQLGVAPSLAYHWPVEFFCRISPEARARLLPVLIKKYNEWVREQNPVQSLMDRALEELQQITDAEVFSARTTEETK